MRLKGFYKKDNQKVKEINNYNMVEKYIKDYCSYGCRYFILKRLSDPAKNTDEKKNTEIKTDKDNKNNSNQKFNKNNKNNKNK